METGLPLGQCTGSEHYYFNTECRPHVQGEEAIYTNYELLEKPFE